MIKKIKKPNIKFSFCNSIYDKYYYDDKNNEFFIIYFESKFYFNLDGNYHRIGKPAIEYSDGGKIWILNGKKHRLDGPASYTYTYKKNNNTYNKYYCINNKSYSVKKFAVKTNHLLCKNCGNFCKQECFF